MPVDNSQMYKQSLAYPVWQTFQNQSNQGRSPEILARLGYPSRCAKYSYGRVIRARVGRGVSRLSGWELLLDKTTQGNQQSGFSLS